MREITIIIPVYNMQEYIRETLISLDNQRYKNFNIIIIDDGSKDSTRTIINDYMLSSSLKILYEYQDNKGVSSARNRGLDLCKTHFLFFLDADDTLPNYSLESFAKYDETFDVIAGYTEKKYVEKKDDIKTHEGINYLLKDYLFRNTKYQFCSFLYKKDIIDKYSIRFSEDLKYGEDEEFAWKYLCHCRSAITLDVNIYNYRDNPNSASHNLSMSRTQVIDTMVRVGEYYASYNHPFTIFIKKYGIPRAKLSVLKQFAINDKKDFFNKLSNSNIYNFSVLSMLKFPDMRIKIAAFTYFISPYWFYKLLRKNH